MKHAIVLVAALASACAGFAADQAPVTPQRPTLSSNTATTAPGTVEVEAGAVLDHDDSYSLPATVKWGTSEDTEFFAGLSPWVLIETPGRDLEGASDLQLGGRRRFVDETSWLPALAAQATARLATANDEIGSGENDVFLAAIADKTIGVLGVTAFYQLGVLGDASGRGTDLQHDVALAAGLPLDERWGVFGELAGTFIPDLQVDSVFTTGGVTWSPRPCLVFDGALAVGLNDDAPDVQILIGCTCNLGRFFDWIVE